MGLDMYAYAVEKGDAIGALQIKQDCKTEQLHYWRKHHDLHGWMCKLFMEKGGEGDFNCKVLELTNDDLDALQKSLAFNALPHTTGFFFGENPPDDETLADDRYFIEKARQAIKDGKAVYYDSWW